MKFDFGISKARNIQLWPLLTITNEPGYKRTEILSGIYDYQKHSKDNPFVKTHLFPLYWFNSSKGKSFRLVSLYYPSLFHYENTRTDSMKTWSVLELAPGISFFSLSSSPQGSYIENNLFFLLWYKNDRKLNRSHFVFFPLIWNYKNPTQRSFTFVPLFAIGHRYSQYSYYAITPFFWHVSDYGLKRNILFPIFWQKKKGIAELQERKTILFPFYFGFKGPKYSNQILFPFLFSHKNENYRSFTFIPLFSYGHSPDKSKSHFALSTFFWHFSDPQGYSNILFPFWWNGRHDFKYRSNHYNVLFPFYWSFNWKSLSSGYSKTGGPIHSDTLTSKARIYFPFVWKFNNHWFNSFTLFPFYSHGESVDGKRGHLSVGTLYWHFKSEFGADDIVFPFWWSGHTKNNTYTKNHKVLFPLWWCYNSTSFASSSTKAGFSKNRVLFPFFWSLKNEKRTTFTLFPLFSRGTSTDNLQRHLIVTPLFGMTQNKSMHRTFLFPLFNYENNAGAKKTDVLFILYRAEHSPVRKSVAILFPFCEYARDSSISDSTKRQLIKTSFRIAPLVWYAKTKNSYLISILPFYSYRRDSSAVTKHILWPVYRSKEIFGVAKYHSILWQLFTSEKDVNGDGGVRFLYRIYANVHKDGGTEKSIFPLVYNTTNKDGSFYHSYFLSFYNYRKHKIENSNYYYQEQRIFWLLRLRSNYRSLKEKGIVTKRKGLR
jgi:hypothetical protein